MPATKRNATSTTPATARGQRTRRRLLDAAEQVFGTSGYERASIVDITQQAGVALGTFYVYFASKQSIFVELVETLGANLRQTLREAVAEADGRLEVERVGLEAFLDFIAAHEHMYKIVRQCEFVDEAVYRAYYTRLADGYVSGLRDAMGRGEIRELDPEAVAYALMGIFDFVGMRWILWQGEKPARRILDDVFSLLAYGLAPEADGQRGR